MSFFDKLFGSQEFRTAKQIVKRAEAEVNATYSPLEKLCETIVRSADNSQRALAPALGFSLEGRPSEPQILVFYELLYFFSHLTLRSAVSAGFTEPQIARLQGYLGPVLSSTAVATFFHHWPEQLRSNIRSEFYERLNDAEVDYSECRGLLSRDEPFTKATLLGRLSSNIADLCERSGDQGIMIAVTVEVGKSYGAMQLERLVGDVHGVIDSAIDELPPGIPRA